ncbi:hypothetical protein DV735_g4476, partial [Chaetothyriales sp. CBS 134920]
MFPPSQGSSSLDLAALSGICGSVSIACWVVVFSPQIIENFRRSSADGLSIVFLVVWLVGDVFNIIGAILQGVLPTMIILAVYYSLADIVLILQVFYYRGFTLSDTITTATITAENEAEEERTRDPERQPLLNGGVPEIVSETREDEDIQQQQQHAQERRSRRGSSLRDHLSSLDPARLSPATPLHDASAKRLSSSSSPSSSQILRSPGLQTALSNTAAILMVCAAGVLGWWLSARAAAGRQSDDGGEQSPPSSPEPVEFNFWGQVFGYLCAVLYLGSRIPQLLLNYRRKSTEGVSLLFFLFACIGNLTYDLSIFAYDPTLLCRDGSASCRPGEAERIYAKYIAVNASWIAGSLGTLFLDMCIFVQFFLYRTGDV